jgi:ribosomal protein S18 acetylase RimI-like enzyme
MELKQFELSQLQEVVSLWNKVVAERDFYKQLTVEQFKSKIIDNEHFLYESTYVAIDNNQIIGFANGFAKVHERTNPDSPAYMTCVIVDKVYRKQGIGKQLLKAVEGYFKSIGKKAVRLVFLNAVNFEWYVPNTDHHDHPGAPAVPYNSPEYFFYLHNDYHVQGHIDAFHLPLSEYQLPQKVIDKMEENKQKGFFIEVYDSSRHYGWEEFYQNIQNPGFENAIRNALKKEKPDPLLVAHHNGRIIGWTGPMYNQPSGRGYFAGIAVDPNVGGGGIGKSLFCMLCEYSKNNGAKFMTFFTGLENPARNIYLYAGFKIIQSFAIMKKEL